jgi:hypothetical protein
VAFAIGSVYALSILPGMRGDNGFVALLDGWANNLFDAGVISLAIAHAWRYREDRRAWLCLAAALTAYLSGGLGYY